MASHEEDTMSSFSMVSGTPLLVSSATEDMRRMALGGGDLSGLMEEEGAQASEGSKKGEGEGRKKTSLACQYCFRTMAPSKHDRCTFCSVCHEQMVET
eukprot:303928-Rhodomonas_salina.2